MQIKKLFSISRYRFWVYVFGPYIVGLAAGSSSVALVLRWEALVMGLFFLLPANLLIYGVNDIFDEATDALNPKKQTYEARVTTTDHRSLISAILVLNIPFVLMLLFIPFSATVALMAFLFLSIFYSAPPIRAKARPFVDTLFNGLYLFPGLVGFYIVGGQSPSPILITGAWLWCMAMHAYSAVPDIRVDRLAGIATIATWLDHKRTILFVIALYTASALLLAYATHPATLALLIPYLALGIRSYHRDEHGVFVIYRFFPLVNIVVGAILFFLSLARLA